MVSVSPRDFLVEMESTLEEVGEYFSDYDDYHVVAARSLIFSLYSAAGGDEWSLEVKAEESGAGLAVSVRGVSLEVEGA